MVRLSCIGCIRRSRSVQVNALQTKFSAEYAQQEFTNYTVNGQVTGVFKNAGTFSYVRIFGA